MRILIIDYYHTVDGENRCDAQKNPYQHANLKALVAKDNKDSLHY
jgi:hypothetical protein